MKKETKLTKMYDKLIREEEIPAYYADKELNAAKEDHRNSSIKRFGERGKMNKRHALDKKWDDRDLADSRQKWKNELRAKSLEMNMVNNSPKNIMLRNIKSPSVQFQDLNPAVIQGRMGQAAINAFKGKQLPPSVPPDNIGMEPITQSKIDDFAALGKRNKAMKTPFTNVKHDKLTAMKQARFRQENHSKIQENELNYFVYNNLINEDF